MVGKLSTITAILLIGIVLLSGCTQPPSGQTTLAADTPGETKYVCPNGMTVSNPSLCQIEETDSAAEAKEQAQPISPEGTLEQAIFTSREIAAYEEAGRYVSKMIGYTFPEIVSDRAKVGEKLLLDGSIQANVWKERCGAPTSNSQHLSGFIEGEQINVYVYKNDLELHFESVMTDEYGNFKSEKFIPRESGYYKVVFKYLAGNCNKSSTEDGIQILTELSFYAS